MVANRNYTKKIKIIFSAGSPANSNLIGITKNCKGWYESYSDVTMGTGIYLIWQTVSLENRRKRKDKEKRQK